MSILRGCYCKWERDNEDRFFDIQQYFINFRFVPVFIHLLIIRAGMVNKRHYIYIYGPFLGFLTFLPGLTFVHVGTFGSEPSTLY